MTHDDIHEDEDEDEDDDDDHCGEKMVMLKKRR